MDLEDCISYNGAQWITTIYKHIVKAKRKIGIFFSWGCIDYDKDKIVSSLWQFFRVPTVLQERITKSGSGGGRFNILVLWTVQAWGLSSVEENQTAIESQQEVWDEARWWPHPAQHQGPKTWRQWQLHMSSRECGNHCKCGRERCVYMSVCWMGSTFQHLSIHPKTLSPKTDSVRDPISHFFLTSSCVHCVDN